MAGRPLRARCGMGRPSRPRVVENTVFPQSASASFSAAVLRQALTASASLQAQVDEGTGPNAGDASYRYVNPARGTNGDGMSWATAFNALPTTLQRGLTYWLADGNYAGRGFSTAASGTTLITIKKATLASHGEDISGGWSSALGDGQANFTSGLSFSTNYWLIDGQTGWWGDGSQYGIVVTETGDTTPILGFYGGSNQTVRHVRLQGRTDLGNGGGSLANDAMRLDESSFVTVSYCEVTDAGRCAIWGVPRDFVFEHSWVRSYHSTGPVHSELASLWKINWDGSNIGNATFRYNLLSHFESTGGIMYDSLSNQSASCMIYGNVFAKLPSTRAWGYGDNGLIGSWDSAGAGVANMKVFNNSFVAIDGALFGPNGVNWGGNEMRNNLFYNCVASPVSENFDTLTHNHFINSPTGGTSVTTASGDPFVNWQNRDFRLTAATPAGFTLSSPYTLDPLGSTRGADGNWDRGAFEKV